MSYYDHFMMALFISPWVYGLFCITRTAIESYYRSCAEDKGVKDD